MNAVPPGEKRHFLLLLSLTKHNAAIGKKLLDRIHKTVDPTAAPLWIDSHGIGVFLSADTHAYRLWQVCFWDDESLSLDEKNMLKDALMVQVGPDFMADGKAAGWLNSRFPRH